MVPEYGNESFCWDLGKNYHTGKGFWRTGMKVSVGSKVIIRRILSRSTVPFPPDFGPKQLYLKENLEGNRILVQNDAAVRERKFLRAPASVREKVSGVRG